MSDVTLISFHGDQFVESFHPNCIVFHRMLNLMKVSYDCKTVTASGDSEQFSQSLIAFPIVEHKKQYLYYFSDLEAVFGSLAKHRSLKSDHPAQNPFQQIFMGWAHDTLDRYYKYFMFYHQPTWQRFVAKIKTFGYPEAAIRVIEKNREASSGEIKRSVLNRMQHEDVVKEFGKEIMSLDSILGQRPFLTNSDLNIADVITFSYLHLLFHPLIEQLREEASKLKNLNCWAKQVDEASGGRFTKSVNL